MIDFDELVTDPIYDTFGETAHLDLGLNGAFDVVAIDHTAGVTVDAKLTTGGARGLSPVEMPSIKPAAAVRASELLGKGIDRAWLRGRLTLYPGSANEKTWRVVSHAQKPGGNGENSGEVLLMLQEPT